jgi:hypothetical protein
MKLFFRCGLRNKGNDRGCGEYGVWNVLERFFGHRYKETDRKKDKPLGLKGRKKWPMMFCFRWRICK